MRINKYIHTHIYTYIYIYYSNKPVEKLYDPTTSCNELLLGALFYIITFAVDAKIKQLKC